MRAVRTEGSAYSTPFFRSLSVSGKAAAEDGGSFNSFVK